MYKLSRATLTGLLAMALVVTLGAPAQAAGVPADLDASRATVLQYTNQLRADVGAKPLTEDVYLDSVAQAWAQVMADQLTMWHNPCLGPQLLTRTNTAGENIAMGKGTNDQAVVTSLWRNSPGHYANMTETSYKNIGIGKAFSKTGVPYWVQDFGGVIVAYNPSQDEYFTATRAACQQEIQDVYTQTGTTPSTTTVTTPSTVPSLPTPTPVVTANPTPTSAPQPVVTTPPTTKPAPVEVKVRPAAPKQIRAQVKGTRATLRWQGSDRRYAVKQYRLEVRDAKTQHLVYVASGPATKLSIQGFHGAKFSVRVKAKNAKGWSNFSRALTFKMR